MGILCVQCVLVALHSQLSQHWNCHEKLMYSPEELRAIKL